MHTPGPWAVAWDFSIIPEAHIKRALGGASDDDIDRDKFAQTIARADLDRHGRGDRMANAKMLAAGPTLFNMVRWCVNHDGECLADHPELLEAARAAIAELES